LILHIQRFENYVNKVNAYKHNLFFPVDSLDLRKFATVSRDPSVKLAVYNVVGVVSLSSFLNANKFHSHVLNQREKRWYLYEEDEKAS
jgi:ubiquitin C-terminal hydrolase